MPGRGGLAMIRTTNMVSNLQNASSWIEMTRAWYSGLAEVLWNCSSSIRRCGVRWNYQFFEWFNSHARFKLNPKFEAEGEISLLALIGAQVLNDKLLPVNNDLQNWILQMAVDHSPCGLSTDPLVKRTVNWAGKILTANFSSFKSLFSLGNTYSEQRTVVPRH